MAIDLEEATRLALAHVGADASVEHCTEPPPTFYSVREPNTEFLFLVVRKRELGVGGSDIIAVDRQTGAVRMAGNSGE